MVIYIAHRYDRLTLRPYDAAIVYPPTDMPVGQSVDFHEGQPFQ